MDRREARAKHIARALWMSPRFFGYTFLLRCAVSFCIEKHEIKSAPHMQASRCTASWATHLMGDRNVRPRRGNGATETTRSTRTVYSVRFVICRRWCVLRCNASVCVSWDGSCRTTDCVYTIISTLELFRCWSRARSVTTIYKFRFSS